MWRWLKCPDNQKTLVLLGSAIAGVSVGIWAVYTHFFPAGSSSTPAPARVEAECGVAFGNNQHLTINCNAHYTDIEELALSTIERFELPKLLATSRELSSAAQQEINDLAAALGLSMNALRSFLTRLARQTKDTTPPPSVLA